MSSLSRLESLVKPGGPPRQQSLKLVRQDTGGLKHSPIKCRKDAFLPSQPKGGTPSSPLLPQEALSWVAATLKAVKVMLFRTAYHALSSWDSVSITSSHETQNGRRESVFSKHLSPCFTWITHTFLLLLFFFTFLMVACSSRLKISSTYLLHGPEAESLRLKRKLIISFFRGIISLWGFVVCRHSCHKESLPPLNFIHSEPLRVRRSREAAQRMAVFVLNSALW